MSELESAVAGAGPSRLQALGSRREVQLSLVRLSAVAQKYDEHWQSLSAEEKVRAQGFHFVRDRERFVAARGRLRALLGGYLEVAPQAVELAYGEHGKPHLARECGLQFNLAHSGDFALYAFCAGAAVGVDVEQMREMSERESLARRFFSSQECRDLEGLPAAGKEAAFFACWTRKEAYLKALGAGLSLPLHSFRVSLLPGEPPQLLSRHDSGEWTMFEVVVAPGYCAAVVVAGEGWSLAQPWAEESARG